MDKITIIWGTPLKNLSTGICRSGPSIFGNGTIGHDKIYQLRANVRIRLCACVGWSETALFAHAWRHISAWRGPYYCIKPEFALKYRIRPNYRIYPYKRTVKQYRSLQITASVLFVYLFIKAYVVVLIWIASTCRCNSNEYPQHMF